MPLVDRLERKYGWIAIPGIVRILVGFQLLMFFLTYIRQDLGLMQLLMLDPGQVLGGQVWRLVSFTILPPTLNPLLMVFVVLFTIFLGEILERMWGSFRLTLYVLGGIAGLILASFFAFFLVGELGFLHFAARAGLLPVSIEALQGPAGGRSTWATMLLLAVAVFQPQYTVHLFGVIPIKMMYLAFFAGGIILIDLFQLTRLHPFLGIALLIAISNFLIAFGPPAIRQMKQRSEAAARRHRFESAQLPSDEALHRCASCGMTEHDDEDLEFRVAADGEEYCSIHLPGKSPD